MRKGCVDSDSRLDKVPSFPQRNNWIRIIREGRAARKAFYSDTRWDRPSGSFMGILITHCSQTYELISNRGRNVIEEKTT